MDSQQRDVLGTEMYQYYVSQTDDYKDSHVKNEEKVIATYNEENSAKDDDKKTTSFNFVKPEDLSEVVPAEIQKLQEMNMDTESIRKVLESKYGITFNPDGDMGFSKEYEAIYSKLYEEINNKTQKDYYKLNPHSRGKAMWAESFEGTIVGSAYEWITHQQLNPDYGMEYTKTEEWTQKIGHIVLDPTIYVGGWAISLGSKAITTARTGMILRNAAALETALIVDGIEAHVATRMVQVQLANKINKLSKVVGASSSGANLAAYTMAAEFMESGKYDNLQSLSAAHLAQTGLINGTLGVGIWGVGRLTLAAQQRLRAKYGSSETHELNSYLNETLFIEGNLAPSAMIKGVPKLEIRNWANYTKYHAGNIAAKGGGLTLEAHGFMAIHYDKSKSYEENIIDNFIFIGSLKATHLPFKIVKMNSATVKGKRDFQLGQSQIDKLNHDIPGANFKNSGEVWDYLNKEFKNEMTWDEAGNLSTEKVESVSKIIKSLEVDVMNKYLFTKNMTIQSTAKNIVTRDVHYNSNKGWIEYKDANGNIIQTYYPEEVGIFEVKDSEAFAEAIQNHSSEVLTKGNILLAQHGISPDGTINAKSELGKRLLAKGVTNADMVQYMDGRLLKKSPELNELMHTVIDHFYSNAAVKEKMAIEG